MFRENPFDTARSILKDDAMGRVESDIGHAAKGLLAGLLNRQVHDRIKIADALKHPWLSEA